MPPDTHPVNRHLHVGDEILGRYVVRAEFGQGGMGVVAIAWTRPTKCNECGEKVKGDILGRCKQEH